MTSVGQITDFDSHCVSIPAGRKFPRAIIPTSSKVASVSRLVGGDDGILLCWLQLLELQTRAKDLWR